MLDCFARALSALAHGFAPQPPPAASPEGARIRDVLAILEARDFTDAHQGDPVPDRFALIAHSLDASLYREARGLVQVEAIEREPRPQGRPQGLEWAYDQLFVEIDRLRQARDLVRELAPIEPQVRALLAAHARRA